jgi:protein-L-isoaspartate(D-aspartate) O-methyltransferase
MAIVSPRGRRSLPRRVVMAGGVVAVFAATIVLTGGCDQTSPPSPATGPASRPATRPGGQATTRATWKPPRFTARQADRDRMVEAQIASPRDGRPAVRDPAVLAAMRNVPRHEFVRPQDVVRAYADGPLPIGHGQTISQPYIVALMTEALRLGPDDKVFEVGTGSGYQAAVLAELTPHVYTVEIVKPLATEAAARLKRLKYDTVRVRAGDGYEGWPSAAPFDAMIVTCAADRVPEPLWEQLKPGGRMVIPVGPSGRVQNLTVIVKGPNGERKSDVIIPCAFVPMTGKIQE